MTETHWFERPEVSAVLEKRLSGFLAGYRQNIALLGPESVGKTAFLKRFLRRYAADAAPLIIYLEIQEGENLAEWAGRFIETLLRAVIRVENADGAPSALADLLCSSTPSLPQTSALAEKLLCLAEERKSAEELFSQLWDLPQIVTQETGLPCLLVVDEFHRLSRLRVKDPFQKLGQKIMVQGGTMYLLVSSEPQMARQILREGLSLLFGQFEIVEMGPLDSASSLRTMRSVLAGGEADPFLEYLLVELTQGYPAYLDLLLQGLGGRPLPRFAEDREREVILLLERLLLDPASAWRHRFESRLKVLPVHRSRRAQLQVLIAVASGCHRVPQIAHTLERNRPQVLAALKVLEQSGLVLKQGGFYRISDKFFRLWLMTAYPILQGTALSDLEQGRSKFRRAAGAWIAKAREAMHRSLEEQSIAFIRQWAGEFVEVEQKRILLPRLERVAAVSIGAGRPVIAAHPKNGQGKSWLWVLWAGVLEEAQAREVAQELSGPAFREYHKVMAGAQPVEVNARLVLQQAKIRVWDLEQLNHLLDLYGLMPIPLQTPLQPPLASTIDVPTEDRTPASDLWIERAT